MRIIAILVLLFPAALVAEPVVIADSLTAFANHHYCLNGLDISSKAQLNAKLKQKPLLQQSQVRKRLSQIHPEMAFSDERVMPVFIDPKATLGDVLDVEHAVREVGYEKITFSIKVDHQTFRSLDIGRPAAVLYYLSYAHLRLAA